VVLVRGDLKSNSGGGKGLFEFCESFLHCLSSGGNAVWRGALLLS
jgi:hypothetical protein